MAYPNDIDIFNDKLNKIEGNTYVIEEKVDLVNGSYDGELAHDNISLSSLNVYTGEKLTGNKVDTYTLSTPSTTPWKKIIKIYSSITPLYISYETTGDTVEADDINKVQDSIVNTQKTLNSEINRAKNTENVITDTINTNKPVWDDKYTKNEVDNKISEVVTNLDWKEAVATFTDLATTYPNAEDGWTASTKDTNIVYRYNGSAWIAISANSIPLATSSVDGLMSKQDKINHDDMVTKKHTHSNLSLLESITQTLISGWNNAVNHISDTVKHITSDERTLWNTVSNKTDKGHTHVKTDITDFPTIPTKTSQLSNDSNFVTQTELGEAGYGDMVKNTYDKNNDGIVDNASALQGHPASDFLHKAPITWNDLKGV